MNDIQELMLEDLDNVNGGNIQEDIEIKEAVKDAVNGEDYREYCDRFGEIFALPEILLDKYGIGMLFDGEYCDGKYHNKYIFDGEPISHIEVLCMIYGRKK